MAFEVFISYSHEDQALREELEKHLANLKRQDVITSWSDGDIIPGTELEPEIMKLLKRAQVILLLVSADFMASDFCYSIEMKEAIARHDANQARVIPILLRPTDWQGAPFAKLKMLPTGAKAVTRWPTPDDAFVDVLKGIRAAIEDLMRKGQSSTPLPTRRNIPYERNSLFTGREDVLKRLRTALKAGKTTALTQPQAISGLGGIVRHEAARVIVSGNNGVRTKPAVPPAVSLNGEAGRQPPVRSPLTTTLNHKVGSQTARGDCYLLASKRIRG